MAGPAVARLGGFFGSGRLWVVGPFVVSSWGVGLVGLFLHDDTLNWLDGLHAG